MQVVTSFKHLNLLAQPRSARLLPSNGLSGNSVNLEGTHMRSERNSTKMKNTLEFPNLKSQIIHFTLHTTNSELGRFGLFPVRTDVKFLPFAAYGKKKS